MENKIKINATDALVKYISTLSQKQLPYLIKEKAKECILDFVGVTYAGAKENRERMTVLLTNRLGKCSLIGYNQQTDVREAAFVNAFNAHTIELDDGSRFGMIHLGASIISAAIAASEDEDLMYEQIIKGVVIGYETAVRLSLAMNPNHKKKGFHTSGTCGTIGAAVAVAIALGYNETQLKAVISAAATSAAGLLEIQEGASTLKPYNLGHAAMSGLNAAYMGMTGFCGPDDILCGTRGMMHLLSDTADIEKMTERTDYYEIERIYVKPYASCRHCHSAIEGALFLREHCMVPIEEIESIQVDTYALAVEGHDHTIVQGAASAKLSMPFSVATAYLCGSGGIDAFTEECVLNERILELTSKVKIVTDQEMSEQASGKRIANVNIITNKGEKYNHRVEYAKGDPENPMTREELISKFKTLMEWADQSSQSEEIIQKIFEK